MTSPEQLAEPVEKPHAKQTSFTRLSDHAFAYTAEGDPNAGVIIGDDAVMVVDTTATPLAAQAMIARIRDVTDKPIRYVALSHYHAVRVLGTSAFQQEGLEHIITSRGTKELFEERGIADMRSEIDRFPHLFAGLGPNDGHPVPSLVIEGELAIDLGGVEVQLRTLGRGHTKGDMIAWLPEERICFSGDLVEANIGVYTGDAYIQEWSETLDRLRALRPQKLVPGRGPALATCEACNAAIAYTQSWLEALYGSVSGEVAAGKSLQQAFLAARAAMDPTFGHVFIYRNCIPFGVARAYDEAMGIEHPQIWTAERDRQLWNDLDFQP